MYLKYGNYTHEIGECAIVIQKESVLNAENNKVGWRETWQISGMLRGTDAADLTTKLRALESAYGFNGRDLILVNDDGTETAHKLISNRSRSGVMISRLDYPVGEGAEYTTFRNYQIIAECDISILEIVNVVGGGGRGRNQQQQAGITLSYVEAITTRGTGGPRVVVIETMGGPVVKQIVSKETAQFKTQSGSATGMYGYPAVPPPIDPANEIADRRVIQQELPTTISQTGKESIYKISWSYEFVS
jgi:hypothetical protein